MRFITCAAAAIVLTAFCSTVQGQPQERPALEIIDVRARLWREDVLQVPGSVAGVERGRLGTALYDDMSVLQQASANIALDQSSVQTRVTLRGVGGVDGGLQDPLGYAVNEVALPLGGNQLPALFPMESMTLLKGPQGTLFGRNTEAGALRLETPLPSFDAAAWTALTAQASDGAAGDAPAYRAAGGVGGTLIPERLAGSLTLAAEDIQGPYLNRLNGSDDGGAAERRGLALGLRYLTSGGTQYMIRSVFDALDQQRNRFRFATGTPRFVTNADTAGHDDSQSAVHALQITHAFPAFQLSAITGFTDYSRNFAIDLDATPAPLPPTLFALEDHALSQEFRLESLPGAGALRWLAGLYLYDEETDVRFRISPQAMTAQRTTAIDERGAALFGHVEYSLTPQWKVALGARSERLHKSGAQRFANAAVVTRYGGDADNNELLPRLSLSYAPASASLLYLSWTKGYLPGGFNYNTAGNAATFAYGAETSTTLEAGWKFRGAGERLELTAALFDVRTRDKQIVDLVPGGLQKIANAARVQVQGAELSLNASIAPPLSAYLNLGWQQAEARDFRLTVLRNGTPATLDLAGKRLPYAPGRSYSAGLHYRRGGFSARLDVRGAGRHYFDSQNLLLQPAYRIVNAEAGYVFGTATLTLWAENLGDEAVLSRAVQTPAGVVVEDMLPKTLGLTLALAW